MFCRIDAMHCVCTYKSLYFILLPIFLTRFYAQSMLYIMAYWYKKNKLHYLCNER